MENNKTHLKLSIFELFLSALICSSTFFKNIELQYATKKKFCRKQKLLAGSRLQALLNLEFLVDVINLKHKT